MQVPFLDLKAINDPLRHDLEKVYQQVLDESHFIFGKQVQAFESAFALKTDVSHCVALGNCTDALYITLKMLGIEPGDEVIVPAMTWISDAAVVSQLGAIPVFVDVDDQGLLNIDLLEDRLTQKTKAIIPVHLYGQMVNMKRLMSLADEYKLKVVEDCAQSHFACLDGKPAGSFGHAAVFSFYPTKNMGALGDAGCMVTSNEQLALACRKYANHGGLEKDSHEFVGVNSRMDTLQAAILLLKLDHIDNWSEERRQLASRYQMQLAKLEDLFLPKNDGGSAHVFHIYAIRTEGRDQLKTYLSARGIQTQIHYPKALPFTSAYNHLNFQTKDFPIAYQLQEESLSLPIYPGLTDEKQAHIIASIQGFFKG